MGILNDDMKQKHSASYDGLTTMKLFQYYVWCRWNNMQTFNNKIQMLANSKIEPSFSKIHPVFEGVQMISKKYKGVPYITSNVRQQHSQQNVVAQVDEEKVNENENDTTNETAKGDEEEEKKKE